MAVSVVLYAGSTSTSTTASVTVAQPSAGNLLVFGGTCGNGTGNMPAPDASWSGPMDTSIPLRMYWKLAGSSEPTTVSSTVSNAVWSSFYWEIQGCGSWNCSTGGPSSAGTTHTFSPGPTVAQAPDASVCICIAYSGATSTTWSNFLIGGSGGCNARRTSGFWAAWDRSLGSGLGGTTITSQCTTSNNLAFAPNSWVAVLNPYYPATRGVC